MEEELQKLRDENRDLKTRLNLALWFIGKVTEFMKLYTDDFREQARIIQQVLED